MVKYGQSLKEMRTVDVNITTCDVTPKRKQMSPLV